MNELTHIDSEGRVRMVDVSPKGTTERFAVARGTIAMRPETFDRIRDHRITKGNVLETARIAGIMAAKRTADLIPMCHPLNLTHVALDFSQDPDRPAIHARSQVRVLDRTGVEMEALTAVSAALLTIYDMCKAIDREMTIERICLLEKAGGKSGHFRRDAPQS